MQLGGQLQSERGQGRGLGLVQAVGLLGAPAGQLGGEEGQGGEQQPGVVVDVGLDEAVPVTDADGDHRIHGDAVRGEVAERGTEEGEKKQRFWYSINTFMKVFNALLK